MTQTTRTVLKWLLLAILVAYAIAMTAWATTRAAERVCPGVEIEVTGAKPGTEATIRHGVEQHLSRLVQVKGKPVGSLDLHKIQIWMSQLNNLENATCAFAPDGRLVIRADALVPEMRVFGPGGQSYYINREGKRMQARTEFFVDAPVVYGQFGKDFSEKSLLPILWRINDDPLLRSMITMVEVRSPRDIILVPRAQGHVVNFGDTTDIDRKLTALKAFYRKVMPARGWQTYDMVSVKYAGRVTATLRVKPDLPVAVADSVPDVEEQALQQTEIEAPVHPAPLTHPQH